MTNVAVCETKVRSEGPAFQTADSLRRAIREDTVVLDILTQAAELDASAGVLSALRKAVGFTGEGDAVQGTIYRSQSRSPRGRHEKRRVPGRHALERVASVVEEPVRPTIPKQRKPEKPAYVPRHAAIAKQEHTVLLPVVTKRSASHRKEEQKSHTDRWRVAAAGLGAAAVACTGITLVMHEQAGRNLEAPATYVFTPEPTSTGARKTNTAERETTIAQPDTARRLEMERADSPSRGMERKGAGGQTVTAVDSKLTATQQSVLTRYTSALKAAPPNQLKRVCPPALAAQAAVISGWGTSHAAKAYNNPFELKDSKGKLIHYSTLPKGVAAQVQRIVASPYYSDARFFPGQAGNSCAADSRTFVLAGTNSKDVRTNLIFKYFRQKGMEDAQIAGMVGNFVRESGINPATVQKVGGSAKGLAQWEGTRFTSPSNTPRIGLKAFAAKQGKHWSDLYTQLDFIWYEFGTPEKRAYQALRQAATPSQAAHVFAKKFERPNPAPKSIRMDIRVDGAKKAHKDQAKHAQRVRGSLQLMKDHIFTRLFKKQANQA